MSRATNLSDEKIINIIDRASNGCDNSKNLLFNLLSEFRDEVIEQNANTSYWIKKSNEYRNQLRSHNDVQKQRK